MDNYKIKPGYRHNLKPVTYNDSAEDSLIYQKDVYAYAAKLIEDRGFTRVLDVGCGHGLKLEKYILPTGASITGVDENHSVSFCRENHPFGSWVVDDIERPFAAIEGPFDLMISADVVEHLLDPDTLFEYFRSYSHAGTHMLISTPQRDLRRGVGDMGPPANPAHVREWNSEEFKQYVTSQGLDLLDHRIVDLKDGMACCQLSLCTWRSF